MKTCLFQEPDYTITSTSLANSSPPSFSQSVPSSSSSLSHSIPPPPTPSPDDNSTNPSSIDDSNSSLELGPSTIASIALPSLPPTSASASLEYFEVCNSNDNLKQPQHQPQLQHQHQLVSDIRKSPSSTTVTATVSRSVRRGHGVGVDKGEEETIYVEMFSPLKQQVPQNQQQRYQNEPSQQQQQQQHQKQLTHASSLTSSLSSSSLSSKSSSRLTAIQTSANEMPPIPLALQVQPFTRPLTRSITGSSTAGTLNTTGTGSLSFIGTRGTYTHDSDPVHIQSLSLRSAEIDNETDREINENASAIYDTLDFEGDGQSQSQLDLELELKKRKATQELSAEGKSTMCAGVSTVDLFDNRPESSSSSRNRQNQGASTDSLQLSGRMKALHTSTGASIGATASSYANFRSQSSGDVTFPRYLSIMDDIDDGVDDDDAFNIQSTPFFAVLPLPPISGHHQLETKMNTDSSADRPKTNTAGCTTSKESIYLNAQQASSTTSTNIAERLPASIIVRPKSTSNTLTHRAEVAKMKRSTSESTSAPALPSTPSFSIASSSSLAAPSARRINLSDHNQYQFELHSDDHHLKRQKGIKTTTGNQEGIYANDFQDDDDKDDFGPYHQYQSHHFPEGGAGDHHPVPLPVLSSTLAIHSDDVPHQQQQQKHRRHRDRNRDREDYNHRSHRHQRRHRRYHNHYKNAGWDGEREDRDRDADGRSRATATTTTTTSSSQESVRSRLKDFELELEAEAEAERAAEGAVNDLMENAYPSQPLAYNSRPFEKAVLQSCGKLI